MYKENEDHFNKTIDRATTTKSEKHRIYRHIRCVAHTVCFPGYGKEYRSFCSTY